MVRASSRLISTVMVNGQNKRINGDFEYLINGSALDLPGIHRSVSRGHTLFLCFISYDLFSRVIFTGNWRNSHY